MLFVFGFESFICYFVSVLNRVFVSVVVTVNVNLDDSVCHSLPDSLFQTANYLEDVRFRDPAVVT